MRYALIALLPLAACAPSNVEAITQSPTAVTYRVGLSADAQEVEDKANAYCAARGAVARLSGTGPETEIMKMSFYRRQRYECVGRAR